MKTRFTIQQHVATGKELFETRDFLLGLSTSIGKHYPKNSEVVKSVGKVRKAVDALRCELNNCIFQENSGISDKATNVYFSGEDEAFDKQAAEKLCDDIKEKTEIGELFGQENEAIQELLISAFEDHTAETIRQALAMFTEQKSRVTFLGL